MLGRFIFSNLMAAICRATIGPEAYLFWDTYVVKGADKDSSFAWHQDSGYVHHECPMYLTCWVTLDDVTLENGTVSLLPYSQVGIRTVVTHLKDPRTNDLVGYFGSRPRHPGQSSLAGSIVVFLLQLRLSPERAESHHDKLRRTYVAPIFAHRHPRTLDGRQRGQAVPFLKNGEIVWREAASL